MNTSEVSGAITADTEIAGRILDALDTKKITQRDLSDQTGIAYPTLRRSLKGNRSFTFAEFCKIAAALTVQPSELLPDSLATRTAA